MTEKKKHALVVLVRMFVVGVLSQTVAIARIIPAHVKREMKSC